jgi:hypothetical protein
MEPFHTGPQDATLQAISSNAEGCARRAVGQILCDTARPLTGERPMSVTYCGTKGAAKQAGITFPLLECWNPITQVATILAVANGKRVACKISLQVLKERFDASIDQPMVAVAENRVAIRAAALTLLEKSAYEEDGSILIRRKNI